MKRCLLLFCSVCVALLSLHAQPKYEFRAAWIATVDNIDWPSRHNYRPDSQRAEFINLLNMHQRNGLNAVIVQVRPATDAFYPSPFEPWSEWLTGQQGLPPAPYYDPLQFMIEETHKRGMEFHAWCNPYRAEMQLGRSSIARTHITRLHPEWFLTYGDKRYFDPGNKEAQQHVENVIRDLVRRYDIDAVHFDDYFYPYRLPGQAFPDRDSYQKYGNGLPEADWRRSNVDSIIERLSKAIKEENRFCKFGVSPFGVWRNSSQDPEGSSTRGGQTNYDDLYADILLWLKRGWIDYVTPQLYWEFGHRLAAYETRVDWWSRHAYGRHLYIGHGIYRVYEQSNPAWRNRNELPHQISKLREYATVQGSAYYNSTAFVRNPNGWNDSLQRHYYRYPAIVPPMPWIDSLPPAAPLAERQSDSTWQLSVPKSTIRFFLVYRLTAEHLLNEDPSSIVAVLPASQGKALFDGARYNGSSPAGYAVTAVTRNNIEGPPTMLRQ